jgi:thymidylate synthase (FAD)
MTTWCDVKDDPNAIQCLDHGFVVLMDHMGDDTSIAQAARCSYGKGTRSVSDDRSLIRYLVRNDHTSPIEMVEFKFLIKMPIFVMRQHVRHRTASLNEYSGRYSEMTDEMYIPPDDRYMGQSSTNKQASEGLLEPTVRKACKDLIEDSYDESYSDYRKLLSDGLSRELSRIVMPVANYTELYWKIDLKNLLHYINLRDHSHAQAEIAVYGKAMKKLIANIVPLTLEAYDDYMNKNNSMKLSRMEVDLVKRLINTDSWNKLFNDLRSDDDIAAQYGLSKRELQEFKGKLDL